MLRGALKKLFYGNPHFEVIEVTREGGVPFESLSGLAADIVVVDAEAIGRLLTGKGKRGVLSLRQLQILTWIAEGKTSREIAEFMQLSVRTVEHHRAAIKKKLGLKRIADLVKYDIEKRMSDNSAGETKAPLSPYGFVPFAIGKPNADNVQFHRPPNREALSVEGPA